MRNQRGYTLIELMIGLLVGLIVLSAVIYSFLTTLRSSRDVVNSSLLNNEVTAALDLMSGEIRRIGYDSDSSTSPSNGYLKIVSGGSEVSSGNCIIYLYDRTGSDVASNATYSGFRLNSGSIEYADGLAGSNMCAGTWTPVVDPRFNVSALTITATSEALPSTDSMFTVEITVSANVVSDSEWKLDQVSKFVKVRNHYE